MAGFFKELIRMTGLGTSLQELLYAIIMALIFVYAARFGVVEFSGVGEFILVQTGMLVTWGVIDGIIFYYIGACDQRRFRRLISNEEHLGFEERVDFLMDEFGATPLDVLTEEEEREICKRILDRPLESEEESRADRRSMALSSLGCVVFSLLALIPVIVPVLLIEDFQTALVAVSFVCSALLFFVGYMMAPFIGTNKWLTGLSLILLSLAIAVVSVFTGG